MIDDSGRALLVFQKINYNYSQYLWLTVLPVFCVAFFCFFCPYFLPGKTNAVHSCVGIAAHTVYFLTWAVWLKFLFSLACLALSKTLNLTASHWNLKWSKAFLSPDFCLHRLQLLWIFQFLFTVLSSVSSLQWGFEFWLESAGVCVLLTKWLSNLWVWNVCLLFIFQHF